jgi:hypothetical protein
MSNTQKTKGIGRRRDTSRKKLSHDIASVLDTVGATLASARVSSLRPGAAESLACFVEAWQHEHREPDAAACAQAVRLLCGLGGLGGLEMEGLQ